MEDKTFTVGDWVIIKDFPKYENKIGIVVYKWTDYAIGEIYTVQNIVGKGILDDFPVRYLEHYYKD